VAVHGLQVSRILTMRILDCLFLLLAFVLGCRATDDGLTTDVTWDEYSLSVKGERVFVFGGEFHYERLPNPELWRDVFQKYKANGLNAVSIYFFWSYHSAAKGNFDFKTPGKDVQRLFDIAKEEGLYVIARPGPYCNAEVRSFVLACC
jgi:beta-galactosidase GanA